MGEHVVKMSAVLRVQPASNTFVAGVTSSTNVTCFISINSWGRNPEYFLHDYNGMNMYKRVTQRNKGIVWFNYGRVEICRSILVQKNKILNTIYDLSHHKYLSIVYIKIKNKSLNICLSLSDCYLKTMID